MTRPGRGRRHGACGGALAGVPAHRATSAHLQAVYPFVTGGGPACRGTYVGRDAHGSGFFFDPWELYAAGALTNPNLVVVGQIGRGKSTFVKTFVWRQLAFGRQAWVVDPKGEYGPLARAAGTAPLRVAPDGATRLNPLDEVALRGGGRPRAGMDAEARRPGGTAAAPDAPPADPDDLVRGAATIDVARSRANPAKPADPATPPADGVADVRRRTELLCSITEAGLGRPLSPAERTATELAARAASRRPSPTLPDVVGCLLDPDPDLAATVRTDAAGLAGDGRNVALELRRLVEGDLGGMFDGPTTAATDLDHPLVVLDLSAVYDSPALGILMTCATAWLMARLRRGDGVKRLVVVDEAWAVLHDLGTARWLQSSFKLSRAYGVANVAVVHRLSDLRAAGDGSSAQRRLAEGILADSETRVIFAQSPGEVADARRLLGLNDTEAAVIAQLPRAVALWKVGDRAFLVEHALGRAEAPLVSTDAAMTGP